MQSGEIVCIKTMDSQQSPAQPPVEAIAHLRQAYKYRSQGEFEAAFSECEEAISLASDWADAHYLKGLLLQSTGNKTEADDAFLRAGRLDSSFKKMRPRLFEGEIEKCSAQQSIDFGNYPPPLWNYQEAWIGFLMFVVLSIAFYIVAGWAFWMLDITFSWEILLVISELVFVLPVWWLAIRNHQVGLWDLGFRSFGKNTIGIGCGLVIAVNIFTIAYSAAVEYLFDSQLQPDLAPVADEMTFPWLLFVVVVVVAPIVEEVFFRGFLFAGLRLRYGWLKAAIFSSFVFAIIHMQLYAIVPLFLLGFVFAYLFHKSNSIWPGIFLHFVVNMVAMIGEFVIKAD